MEINRYEGAESALRALTQDLIRLIRRREGFFFNIALSGGETAKRLFSLWVNEYKDYIPWEVLHFFWVDERCVPPSDQESNFGQADHLLFAPLQISKKQIYRISGEKDPEEEAGHYSQEVKELLPDSEGIPLFDCIILGVGNDLHTASIFPNVSELLSDKRYYAVSKHPMTGQSRITMTGSLILGGAPLLVPIVGKGKGPVIEELRKEYIQSCSTPAGYILNHAAQATVYVGE